MSKKNKPTIVDKGDFTEVNINIEMPRSWQELSDKQLNYVFGLIADEYSLAQICIFCFVRWAGMRLVAPPVDAKLEEREVCMDVRGYNVIFSADNLAEMSLMLKYLGEPSDVPVRPDTIGRKHPLTGRRQGKALPADFQQVPFRKFLFLENLYQGFLATKNPKLLDDMVRIMYQCDAIHPSSADGVMVFYWFTSLKKVFSRQFPHFFKPSRDDGSSNLLGQSLGRKLQESMDSQIRALTKGDVTKEREVLEVDTWRALAELDALAREADELERKYPSK